MRSKVQAMRMGYEVDGGLHELHRRLMQHRGDRRMLNQYRMLRGLPRMKVRVVTESEKQP